MNKKYYNIIRGLLMMLAMCQYLNADSYYTPYLLVFIPSMFALAVNNKNENRSKAPHVIVFSIIFTLMLCMANYQLWYSASVPDFSGRAFKILYRFGEFVILFSGTFIAFYNILVYIAYNSDRIIWKKEEWKTKTWMVFLISFVVITSINVAVLMLSRYPGNLTVDSINQIKQIASGTYSNHHPFYHTMVIKFVLHIGMAIFGDINKAVALYSICSIVFMAACFSFSLFVMAQLKIPRRLVIGVGLFYALMPYHIMYSFTMWKDIPFAGCFLVLVLAMIRIINKIGISAINYALLCFSGIGVCLFRSNGFLAFVMLVVVLAFVWRRKKLRMLICMGSVIVISIIMKNVVLSSIGVEQPDTIESLSVPAQQIARVIVDYNDLTENETYWIGQVIDIQAVPETYRSGISDPIKNLVRQSGYQNIIKENKFEYIKVYLTIGLRHPATYIEAWVDQTKGYWNSGYSYWRWADNVSDNEFGITRVISSKTVETMTNDYYWLYENVPLMQPLMSIGFFMWVNIMALYVSIVRKDRLGITVSSPMIMVLLTLLVATPVFSELRYVYALFCVAPTVVLIATRPVIKEDYNG